MLDLALILSDGVDAAGGLGGVFRRLLQSRAGGEAEGGRC
jgi:hypothetical protein